jgi:type I restriction enzyme M protein
MAPNKPTGFDALFPADCILRPQLRDLLKAEFDRPEGAVRCAWVSRLIREYGFDSEQVAINVAAGAGRDAERGAVFADIVAYRDKRRREPLLVVETKRPEERSGLKQAESYARNLGADYHVWTNGTEVRFFRTSKYLDQSAELGNVPRWLGDVPVSTKPSKSLDLPPFRDEEHLRKVVDLCHDRIFYRLGHDPAKAFDELMKVLFLKLYDERETPGHYDCVVLDNEVDGDTAARVRELFTKSIRSRRYRDVFTTRFSSTHPPAIDLDDETLAFIVRQFQGYSLINTTATLEGADVKGTVFEKMVGSTFRGELGAYFTPREIVSFMVQLVDPSPDDVVLDPSCGSGGFLIMTLKYMLDRLRRDNPNLDTAEIYGTLRTFAERNVFGADVNERMARVTKMNMIMHGDGHAGVFHMHGLDFGYAEKPTVRPGDITCIFSNPPFAGREEDSGQLEKFSTTRNAQGETLLTPKSIPFVEHIIDLLAEGGRAALVLPSGIFNSRSDQFTRLRELMWSKCEVIAIIGLPHWVFFHTGCDVQGALLFLKRTDSPRSDYNVHIDWAENVGYDAAGRKTHENDFPEILERFKERSPDNQFRASMLRSRGRIDPLYYQPGDHERVSIVSEQSHALTDLATPSREFVKRQRGNRSVVRYIEVGDTDKTTGKILHSTEYEIRSLPARAKFVARENMLLIPNHRNSIKSGRSPVLVPAEYDGAVVTSRFIVVRSKIPTIYLYYILNLDIVKERMLRLVSGSSSTEIKFEQLCEIRVPMPDDGDFDLFLETLNSKRTEVERLRSALAAKEQDLEATFRRLYKADPQPSRVG